MGLLEYCQLGRLSALGPVDMDKLVKDLLQEFQEKLQAIDESATIEGKLPVVHGRCIELQHLLKQLITNAMTYRTYGNVLERSIAAKKRQGSWELVVKDNGVGLKKKGSKKGFWDV